MIWYIDKGKLTNFERSGNMARIITTNNRIADNTKNVVDNSSVVKMRKNTRRYHSLKNK